MGRTIGMTCRVGLFVSTAVLSALTLASCATIIHGTGQEVGISSTPTGAAVWIDNAEKGDTPLVTKLSRKDNHVVKIQLAGYQPFEATLTRGVSGWVWGNVAFGGLIGLAVDAISGGIYKLTPEQISGTLATKSAVLDKKGDGVYVVAVLKPQSDWVKVAQLSR
jgi:PEGA domain